jgi:hypothetical protein
MYQTHQKEIGWEYVDWILLAQERHPWQNFVYTAMNFRISRAPGQLLAPQKELSPRVLVRQAFITARLTNIPLHQHVRNFTNMHQYQENRMSRNSQQP